MWLPSLLSLGVLSLDSTVKAATITYNWNVTWVSGNPDGRAVRPLVGVNGVWPCPKIEGNRGDYIVVNVNNQLGNQTWGIHFHGINQIRTPEMDGPSGVTQCPVPPGSSIQYKFYLDEPGTYWYHSHDKSQYVDGFRGPLIVHDPNDPYKGQYDEEIVMSVSDWYHKQSIDLIRTMLSPNNTNFLPPFPDGLLVNEGRSPNMNMVKGKTYRIRLISYAAIASFMLHFNSHNMQIIMNDATYLQKKTAYMIRIAPAQRYDFLITILEREDRNYPFLVAMDINRDYASKTVASVWPANATGYLMLDANKPATSVDLVNTFRPIDDAHFSPLDGVPMFGPVTRTITLNFAMCMYGGTPRACFNGLPWIPQRVPALYSAATAGDYSSDPTIYGQINPFIVNYGDVVQIVVNNRDEAIHPFHLHGHQFQVLDRPASGTGDWAGRSLQHNLIPSRKDTVTVNPKSYVVLRYVADNPGVFLFHCHIEWHVEMGLVSTIIEAPDRLSGLNIPADHINACKLQGIPYSGNAAGNTNNFTDTSDFLTSYPAVYQGAMYNPPASTNATSLKMVRNVRRHLKGMQDTRAM